jgi:L-fucose isomerase-like protein
VTLVRLYGDRCDQMHVACGDLLACDRTCDLNLSVRLRGPRDDFVGACLGNHYAVVPGDIRPELEFLGECLGATIVHT